MDLAEIQNEIHDLEHDIAGLNEVIVRLQNRKLAAERLLLALLDHGMSAAKSPATLSLLLHVPPPD